MEYISKNYKELVHICKERTISGYSGKKKNYVIELIKRQEKHVEVFQNIQIEMTSTSWMDKPDRVRILTNHLTSSKINHTTQIMTVSTLKEAHTYCVIHGLSAQQYGPLLERFIRTKFQYVKNKAEDLNGDCSKDNENTEVKVSIGGATHTKFNYVQIRPLHDCTTYLLTAYHLSLENVELEGELYIFKIPKNEMKQLLVSYGGYAHGTTREHGPITISSINTCSKIKEYALRPSVNGDCWKALMMFRITEADI